MRRKSFKTALAVLIAVTAMLSCVNYQGLLTGANGAVRTERKETTLPKQIKSGIRSGRTVRCTHTG